MAALWLTAAGQLDAQTAKAQESSLTAHRLLAAQTIPIRFEPNVGQTKREARYVAHGFGYDLFLTPSEAVLGFGNSEQPLSIRPLGARASARPEGRMPVPSYGNYLLGNDSSRWRKHVPHFAEVWYPSVYPGVDLVYYGKSGRLEYDFVVAPHARADRIAFSIAGFQATLLPRGNAAGDLILSVDGDEIILRSPRLFQGKSCLHVGSNEPSLSNSCREITGGRFVVHQCRKDVQVSFDLPGYDHSQTLVIDPVVAYSTLYGVGNGTSGMALDSAGNIYLVGLTSATNFPVTSAAFQKTLAGFADLFISKLNNDATQVIYSTYLGGSQFNQAAGIVVDSAGNVYVTGQTYSTDFPLSHPYQSQNLGASAFLSKLSADGSSLIYSTYLGGTLVSAGTGIALDSINEPILVGSTLATDFPTMNAFQPQHAADGGNSDAFVTKFSADGSSLVFSTYFGGNEGDTGAAVALDPSGNIYVTGTTVSTDFPTTAGSYQSTYVSNPAGSSFVSKFSPSGLNLLYSTYFPASQASAIAVNNSGNAFLTGFTGTTGFPVTPGAFQTTIGGAYSSDAFVTEFDSTGSSLVYSTYLGGIVEDSGLAIAVDASNNASVTGLTYSPDFPLKFPVQTVYPGVQSAFVSELNSTGTQLLFSTYLGGGFKSGSGIQSGTAIAVDDGGNLFVSGGTQEPDFPLLNAFQSTLEDGSGSFLVKFLNEPAPSIGLNPASVAFNPVVVNSASAAQTIALTNVGGATLNVSAVTVTGSFSQTNNCGSGIVPSANCSIQATFAPTSFGQSIGAISIVSNATLIPEVVALSGTGQDFSFQGTPGSENVSPGQSATINLTLTPEGGFAQQITFSCNDAPPGSNCLFSPQSLTLDGTNSANVTLTVTTAARFGVTAPFSGAFGSHGTTLALALFCGLSCGAVIGRKKRMSAFVVLTIVAGLLVGCGGGKSVITSSGTYNINITAASGSVTHSLEFSLTVGQ